MHRIVRTTLVVVVVLIAHHAMGFYALHTHKGAIPIGYVRTCSFHWAVIICDIQGHPPT